MLTPAQQKVKQELEELQLKAQIKQNDEEPSPNKRGKTKWFYLMSGFCVVIISSFLLHNISTATEDEFVSYLKAEQSYTIQSSNLLNEITENHPIMLEEAAEKQADLLQKVNNLKAPARLGKHKQDLLHVMQMQLDLITYLADEKNRDTILVNKKLLELKIAQGLATERLTKTFDKEKINYVQQEDGTIQYWVDTKAYQYHF